MNEPVSIRTNQSAFHPNGAQAILKVKPEIFAVLRTSPNRDQHILCLINVTNAHCNITIPKKNICILKEEWYDLIGEKEYTFEGDCIDITLKHYDVVWLESQ